VTESDEEDLPDLYLGRVLDERYRLVRRLGAGGMGAVYEALHVSIGRRLAVKLLHPQLASSPEVLRRFKNEARACGTLGHPHIVQSIDFGRTDDGGPYIVMEYLEGRDLARAIADEGPFPIARAIAIADKIADALAAAHEKNIVHRDMKPENVFLTAPHDTVKVLDFGISKFSEGDSSVATRTGAIMGSPHYMAPEQVTDASRADHRTDVYSLGALLSHMLTGHTLYSARSLPMLVLAVTTEPPPDVRRDRGDVPNALAEHIARMLAKAPEDRPASMAEVRAVLSAFAGETASPQLLRPSPATDPAALRNTTTPFATEAGETGIEVPSATGPRMWIAAAIAIAVLGVGGAVVAFGGGGPSIETTSTSPPGVAGSPATAAGGEEASIDAGVDAGREDAGVADAGAAERVTTMRVTPGTPSAMTPSAMTSSAMTSSAMTPSAMTPSAMTPSAMHIDGVPIDDRY
jgi:serine/threonine-protein kinase